MRGNLSEKPRAFPDFSLAILRDAFPHRSEGHIGPAKRQSLANWGN
jgi:hypothetical protein